ncbi:aspartic peptidase A1 [Russula dissimulans]|nr:aspartic peptidase A1 [Russula dissimulans]
MPLLWLFPLFFVLHLANAIIIPFRGFTTDNANHLSKRNNLTGIPIKNGGNVIYGANITLGGDNFTVVLDSGSPDLWVAAASVPGAIPSGKEASIAYAIGNVAGNISWAPLTFDNYSVDKQAFILVQDSSSFSPTLQTNGFQGLMGLGFDSESIVRTKLATGEGDTPLSNIFQQDNTTQNFVSLLLDRQNDPGDGITGQITVSELVSGYESVASQPKLYLKDAFMDSSNQHWAVVTDNNGIIGPDGNSIFVESIVPHVSGGKLVVVLDSGFTYTQVPRRAADAIYGRVQGATYSTSDGMWYVPCDQYLNIALSFGGVKYPIHPLDVVSNDLSSSDSNGLCQGAFQPISTAFSIFGNYDMIAGMNALRNFYALLDYGNFVSNTTNDRGDPYVQLLAVTDVATARADFINVRLNGTDATGSASQALLPASQESHSPVSAAEKKQHIEGAVARNWPYILFGCIVAVLIFTGCSVYACCCRKRRKSPRLFTPNPYRAIDEPAPPAMQMRPLNSGAQYPAPIHLRP